MALDASGTLALSEIQTEWGGSNPISMSEYYGDGDNVYDGAADGDGNAIPESGALDISDFYDTVSALPLTISSNTNNYNIATAVGNAGGSLNVPVLLTINNGVTVGSTSHSNPAMTTGTGWGANTFVKITNNGTIQGANGPAGSTGSTGSTGSIGSCCACG